MSWCLPNFLQNFRMVPNFYALSRSYLDCLGKFRFFPCLCSNIKPIYLSTVRPKWRLNRTGLSGHSIVITCQSSLCKYPPISSCPTHSPKYFNGSVCRSYYYKNQVVRCVNLVRKGRGRANTPSIDYKQYCQLFYAINLFRNRSVIEMLKKYDSFFVQMLVNQENIHHICCFQQY